MKKILITLFICSPFLLIGQSKGEFTLKLNEGLIYDSKHTKNDIFTHTPDVYTRHEGTGKAKNGIQLSTGYSIMDNLLVGLSFMSAKIEGSNGIEYTQGKFTETNMFAEYKLIDMYGIGIFTKAGYGGIFYSTDRFLEEDGAAVPSTNALNEDKSDGTASKFLYGMGLSYKIYDAINLSFEVTRNVVYDDGFDGWNEDEWRDSKGTDRFVYASLGLSYTFSKKKKSKSKLNNEIKPQPIVTPIEEKVTPVEEGIETIEEQVPAMEGEGGETIEEQVPAMEGEGGETIEEQVPAMEGEGGEGAIDEPAPVIEEEPAPVEPVEEWLYYTVQSGDYGGVLLNKLGCTKEELCKWNNLNLATWNTNSGGIQMNQVLKYKK